MFEWVREIDVLAFARSHHGLVDRQTALRLGATPSMIRRRLEAGRWVCLRPAVYYANVTPPTWKTDILAAAMAAGPDAVVSHRTAGLLHGLDGIYGNPIDITVPYAESPEPTGVVLHRTRRPIDQESLDSIRITTVERILLDLAGMFGDKGLERVVASALRKRLTTAARIDAYIGLRGGRGVGGTRRMRRVVGRVAEDVSGSVAEIDMGQLIREAPIPSPVAQLQVKLPDGSNAYPDFAWPDRKKIVEVDGLEAHASADQLTHDLNRQNQLMELGWEIRRFPASRVRREPDLVIAEVIKFVMAPPNPVL